MAITDLGLLASGGSRTPNQATFSVFTTAAVAAGELLVAFTTVDVAGLSSGIDASTYDLRIGGTNGDRFLDRLSNQPGTGSQTGVACSLWWMIAPQAYASGTEIIAKYNSPTESDHSALTVRHYGIGLGNIVTQVGGNSGTITTAVQPSTIDVNTTNLTLLRVRGCGLRYPTSPTTLVQFTQTSGWIAYTAPQSGPITSSPDWEVVAGLESVIFTGTSKPSSPTVVQPSAQHTNVYVCLQETPCTGTLAVTEQSLVSVGPNLLPTPLVWTPHSVAISGTTTLTFAEDGTTNYHSASKAPALPAGNYCFSVDYQGTGPSPRNLQAWVFGGSPSHYVSCTVAADGTLIDKLVDPPFTLSQVTVTSVGGGFWNVQIIFSTTTTIDEVDLYVIKPPSTQYYLGLNNGSGINVRNASIRATTADVASFTGGINIIAGPLAATEGSDGVSFSGVVGPTATLEAYEGAVWLRADSTLYTADDNVTRVNTAGQIRDIASFAGVASERYGVFSATEVADAASFAGIVGRSGTLSATEGADTASFAGATTFQPVTGTLAATEAADIAAFAGGVVVTGTLAVTEGADTAAFVGKGGVVGVLAATEDADAALFHGVYGLVAGSFAATETTSDTAAFAGTAGWAAVLAATEGADTAAFTGQLGAVGTLAAVELGADVLAFEGYKSMSNEKVGILRAFESGNVYGYPEPTADSTLVTADQTIYTVDLDNRGGDVARFIGDVRVASMLAATETTADTASFAGEVVVTGFLAAREDRDTAEFFADALGVIHGILAAHEGADTARFLESLLWEGIGEGLRNEVQRTIWLSGLGGRVTWLENEVEDTSGLENLDPEVVSLLAEQERITRLGA